MVYIFIYVGEERGGEKRGERDGRKEKKKKKHLEKILTLFLKSLFFKTSKKPKNFSFFFLRHPEKNAFEWGDKLHIPHSEAAVEVTHAVGKFFVDGARRNSHGLNGDVLAEDDLLIYNHPLTFTGRHERAEDRPWLDEAYIFPPWETWKRCLKGRGGRGEEEDDDDDDDDEELCRRYRSPSADVHKKKEKEKKKRHEEKKAHKKSHGRGHVHKKQQQQQHGGSSSQKKVSLRLAGV